MRNSLAGVRILDLTSYLSGPFATMTLAGLGADVIKVERRDGGDPARTFPPFCGPNGTSQVERTTDEDETVAILKRNRGKRSLTLNLETPEGKALFLKLVAKSDVVIENLAPGVIEKWGLGFDALAARNPRVVMCSISGYGRAGPKKDLPAFDPIVQASSLTMATNGYPDRAPSRTGISFGDTVPALYAVIGILAALRERDRTGKGKKIDVAMHDSLVAMLMVEPVEYQLDWDFPLRTGSTIPRLTPCNVYKCKDGYVALNAAPPRLWRRLATLIDSQDLQDPKLVPLAGRLKRHKWIDASVAEWVVQFAVDDIVKLTASKGIPCGKVVEKLAELIEDPSLRERGMLKPLEHPATGVLAGLYAPSIPIASEAEPSIPLKRAPALGEHTAAILSEELGLTADQIQDLSRSNII